MGSSSFHVMAHIQRIVMLFSLLVGAALGPAQPRLAC